MFNPLLSLTLARMCLKRENLALCWCNQGCLSCTTSPTATKSLISKHHANPSSVAHTDSGHNATSVVPSRWSTLIKSTVSFLPPQVPNSLVHFFNPLYSQPVCTPICTCICTHLHPSTHMYAHKHTYTHVSAHTDPNSSPPHTFSALSHSLAHFKGNTSASWYASYHHLLSALFHTSRNTYHQPSFSCPHTLSHLD